MPSFLKSVKSWIIAILGATLIGVAEAVQLYAGTNASGRQVSFARAASATMPSWYVLLALAPLVLWLAYRFPLRRGRWLRGLAVHVPACVVFPVVNLALASYLSDYLLNPDPWPFTFTQNIVRLLGFYFILDITYYWAFVGAFYAFDLRRRYREKERTAAELTLKASRLEASLARANLDALRMQLNPHFLFNTLNAVSVLALKGERQNVARMLARLSDLLRLALENTEQVVALSEELTFLRPYIEIEQVRFKDRLQVVQDIDPATLDAEVPSLFLQPFVENAVRHGIAQRPGPGLIEIRSRRMGENLVLEVTDTGPGFPAGAEASRRGVGVANARARLEHLYGAAHSLELTNAPSGGAMVRAIIPFREYQGDIMTPVQTEARTA
jgi:two-component system LytT family sensor kinase